MTANLIYSWAFPQIDVAPSLDGLSNVVTCIHWRLIGTRGADTADTYGTVTLPAPAVPAGFIPLASVTEAEAQAWVVGSLGQERVAVLRAAILAQLDEIASPSVVAMAPPWA
jgi:hypothetical protein